MTLTTPYQASFYVGDGETKAFPFVFEELSDTFVKVIVSHIDGTTSVPTYIVDLDLKQVVFGDETPAPTADDVVCIYRETPTIQDTPFKTLEGYNAKALENILSKIVAMIQEIKSNYFSTQVLQGGPWQLDLLKSADDGATVNIDYTAKKLVKGLYFQITDGNLQVSADGSSYITMPKSSDVAELRQQVITLPDLTVIKKLQYRVNNEWFDAETNAQATADEALALAQSVQSTLSGHLGNTNNPHSTSLNNLTDTDFSTLSVGQFIMFDGLKWKNVNSSATVSWGTIFGDITDQTDLMNTFVQKAGDTMSGTLNIIDPNGTGTNTVLKLGNGSTASRQWNFAPNASTQSMSVYPGTSETNGYRFVSTGFCPASNNARYLGASTLKWKSVYTAMINNGGDLVVPAKSGTLATKEEVDLAANSGSQLYDTGVWYAKMNIATVVPTGAEYNDRNYADFSQVDRRSGRPVIVIYSCRNGVWDEVETITPPDSYNGYITITSKIWDIPEQAGQQGGEILWSFERQRFTPYPKIVSFESINVTGDSTVDMPQNPTGNQIVNKDYVDNHIPTGNFYHPDLFAWEWSDALRNDVQWLRADTFSWQSGSVYQAAFNELFYDIQISTYWYSGGGPAYTKSRTPAAGDAVYLNSDLTTQIGTVDSYDDVNDEITVSGDTYSYMSNTYVTPTTETVAGYSLSVYTGHSGRKIVSVSDETNVANIYTATGVAWYYIIDIPNKRFKLPRVNPDVVKEKYGTIPVKGNGLVLGLTNGTGTAGTTFNSNTTSINPHTGSYGLAVSSSGTQTASGLSGRLGVTTDSTKSGIIADPTEQTTIFAGKKYLYFYVGEFTQTALENTAGITAETLNDKVDKGHQVIAFQAPTAGNNYTWYRKYVDGWVEQGGVVASMPSSKYQDVVFPVTMTNANYTPSVTASWSASSTGQNEGVQNLTTTGMRVTTSYATATVWWEVKGMAA